MVLIADSGATKTEWCVIGCGMEPLRFRTGPVNVAVMSEETIRKVLGDAAEHIACNLSRMTGGPADCVKTVVGEGITEVHFFAAGLVGPEASVSLASCLGNFFPDAGIDLDTDLMGAARALWGDEPGIVAILGTGSNSCIYDGNRVVRNVRPGGFVLGDEGGGASLGKMLLADFVKGLLPRDIMSRLENDGLDYATVVKNVYKSDRPSAYLASFAPFVFENKNVFHDMIYDNFRSFIRRSLRQCVDNETDILKVGVVGSIGWAGKDIFMDAARAEGIEAVRFLRAPMDGLIEYYRN